MQTQGKSITKLKNWTFRATPFLSGQTQIIISIGQLFWCASTLSRTVLPTRKFCFCKCYFWPSCQDISASFCHSSSAFWILQHFLVYRSSFWNLPAGGSTTLYFIVSKSDWDNDISWSSHCQWPGIHNSIYFCR